MTPKLVPTKEGVEICPGPAGLKEWPHAAYNQRTGLLYTPVVERCAKYKSAKVKFQRSQLQEAAGRVRSRVTDGLQAGNAQLTRRAGEVTEKVRRRPGEGSGEAQALNGSEISSAE